MNTPDIYKSQYETWKNGNPFIQAEMQLFWLKVFDFAFSGMLKKSFYSVRIKNAEHYDLRDKSKSNIFYANHCCWWDGIIGYTLCRKVFGTNMRMIVRELHRFPLLSKIGAVSVDKSNPYASLKTLNYCTEFLSHPSNSLFVYPQEIVMPPDFRPIEFAGGISYLCKKLEGVNLIPIAHRYTFLREDRPEVLIEIGKPIVINGVSNRKKLTELLEQEFTLLLDNQKKDISNGNLNGYEQWIKSRLCAYKLLEKHFQRFVRSF